MTTPPQTLGRRTIDRRGRLLWGVLVGLYGALSFALSCALLVPNASADESAGGTRGVTRFEPARVFDGESIHADRARRG